MSPRFIETFEIFERIRPVAYRLALPPSLSTVHNVFHVSVLRMYMANLTHVIDYEPLEVVEDLSYEEKRLEILARKVKTYAPKILHLSRYGGETNQWRRLHGNESHCPCIVD